MYSDDELGSIFQFIAAIITFVCAYIYCIFSYGFLFGLGLGWLPSLILAAMVGWFVRFFWLPVLLLVACLVVLVIAWIASILK
jgi:hypothetical protein